MKNIIKFFEIHLGWIFVNGNKTEKWNKYLNEKYGV